MWSWLYHLQWKDFGSAASLHHLVFWLGSILKELIHSSKHSRFMWLIMMKGNFSKYHILINSNILNNFHLKIVLKEFSVPSIKHSFTLLGLTPFQVLKVYNFFNLINQYILMLAKFPIKKCSIRKGTLFSYSTLKQEYLLFRHINLTPKMFASNKDMFFCIKAPFQQLTVQLWFLVSLSALKIDQIMICRISFWPYL